ncbi:MAG: NmrA family NAD(P)-binding protein [Saprospiraceae bacterium]|nr:NmrA family NAD(P)-binding protein [Saprospiraceae bacterium]
MKKILIAGATGNLGPHLVKELVSHGHQVSAMLRPASIANLDKVNPLKKMGVHLVEGDLNNPETLYAPCQGQDVVLSAVGGEQIMMQTDLAKAAAAAGVERFVPSEFGLDPHAAGPGSCDLFDAKSAVQGQIKATGIPTTMIYSNGFMEFWGTGLGQLGPTSPPAEVQLFGNGQTPAYMCTLSDIARYTALIIEDANTLDGEVVISTNPITQEDLIKLWEAKSGNSVVRQIISPKELDSIINAATAPEEMMTRIFTQLHRSVWVRSDCNKIRPEVLPATELYPQITAIDQSQYFQYFL